MKRLLLVSVLLALWVFTARAANLVTFQVNMKVQINIKKFTPATDTVVVRGGGSFYNKWGSGNALKLNDADGDGIYTGTFAAGITLPDTLQYKYVMSGKTAAGDQWETSNDRVSIFTSLLTTLPVVWFSNDSTTVYRMNNTTFQVDMKSEMQAARFVKAADSVVVRGDFNGWGGNTQLLTDADGDSIYTGTYNVGSVQKIIYKFVIHKTSGDTWESSSDRVYSSFDGNPKTLPVALFNQNNNVTFQLNMNVQIRTKKFDSAKDTVVLRGNFYQGSGNWWDANDQKLTDPDGDGIFVGTFDVGAAPKRLGQFKYVMRGVTAPGDRWEADMGANKDRTDTIPSTPRTLPVVWFSNDSTTVYSDNYVTFQVNMRSQMNQGKFNAAKDSVIVRGDFNGWGGIAHLLADPAKLGVYSGTYNIQSVKKIIFKYVIHNSTGDTWESSSDRIDSTLNGNPKTLKLVWFNNDSTSVGTVTFGVNMKVQIKLKKFVAATDTVVIRGGGPFYNKWGIGNANKLNDADGDSIYTGSFAADIALPDTLQYKFVMSGKTVAGDQWETTNDRRNRLPFTPYTMKTVWFSDDSTTVFSNNFITFQVNMKSQMKRALFSKAKDSVVVRGDFNGWGGNTHLLDDANTDSIYSGTYNITSVKKIIYKFVMHSAAGDSWESSSDRIDSTLNGTPKILKVVWFSNDSTLTGVRRDGDAVVTQYELLQNYPNPFNPSTTITFSLLHDGMVSMKIYNLLGQEVATVVHQELQAGRHIATFNANQLSSGAYFYKIEAKSFTSLKKMILMK